MSFTREDELVSEIRTLSSRIRLLERDVDLLLEERIKKKGGKR